MYLGQTVELAHRDELSSNPKYPCADNLPRAIRKMDPRKRGGHLADHRVFCHFREEINLQPGP